MLEILVIIYGIVAMVRGKFSLGSDKTLHGGRARIAAGVLLAYIPLSFMTGLFLAVIGRADIVQGGGAIAIGLGWLIGIVILTLVVGNMLYKKQEQEAASRSGDFDSV